MNSIRAVCAAVIVSWGLAACGGEEGHEEGEHTFDTYAECYEQESAKGASYAITECDEQFEAQTHADRATCLSFYADNGVEENIAIARCDEEFPPA